jgi:ribosomal subunit interface protein
MEIVVKGRHTEVPDRFRRHAMEKLAKMGRFDQKAFRVDAELSEERNPRLSGVRERVELTVFSRGPVIRAEAAASDAYAALDLAAEKLKERLRRASDRRARRYAGQTEGHPRAVAPGDVAAQEGAAAAVAGTRAAGRSGGAAERSRAGGAAERGRAGGAAERGRAGGAAERGRPGGAAERGRSADGYGGDGYEPDLADLAELAERYEPPPRSPLVVREKTHQAAPMTLDEALHNMELVGHDFYLYCDAGSGLPSVVYRRRGYAYGVLRLQLDHPAAGRRDDPAS